jgi:hypothetical protein
VQRLHGLKAGMLAAPDQQISLTEGLSGILCVRS